VFPENARTERLLDLASRFLEGIANREELEGLARRVREDEADRRLLGRLIRQHGTLRRIHRPLPAEVAPPRSRRGRLRALAYAAAAVLVGLTVVLAVRFLRPDRQAAPVAERSRDAVPEPAPVRRGPEGPARIEERPAPVERGKGKEDEARRPTREETPRQERVEKLPDPLRPRTEEAKPDAAKPGESPTSPEPPAPSPAPKERTVAAVAQVELVNGEVTVMIGSQRAVAKAGLGLPTAAGVETVGPSSFAAVRFPDATRLELGGDTIVSELADANGKRLRVSRGQVSADVARQPEGQPLVFVSPHAEAKVLGTALTLVVDPGSSRLEVVEGRVRLVRTADRRTVDVTGGHYAVAGAGIELRALPIQSKVDQKGIDAAIRKGTEFLKKRVGALPRSNSGRSDELVLWTFVHAGLPEHDPDFRRLLDGMVRAKLEFTYNVALQAMILEETDRVRQQGRIWQCAQFLMDNQLTIGLWSYGEPTEIPDAVPTGVPVKGAATPGTAKSRKDPYLPLERRPKPPVVRRIPVEKRRERESATPFWGDFSNSQYAALGLRACHDAGILLPKAVVERAGKAWRDAQVPQEARKNPGGDAGGWNYYTAGTYGYGSMTAGGVGSLVIYDRILGLDWTKDADVREGLGWLAEHFTLTENPGALKRGETPDRRTNLHYYLYALERAGMLYGTETLGRHEWYPEGVKVLLASQRADGSWSDQAGQSQPEWDTCFAILFLKRATRAIDVASVDRLNPK